MNLEKLKDTARKYEQKEDWRRAIDVYLKAIQEFESGKEPHPDLSLYNRVGDLYMKVNDPAAAVRSYERAADLYTEQGFLNNAIALCGKILRVNPGRVQTYYKLAQIHARKNMLLEAKRNLIEYLERMNHAGELDAAFDAVKVFADHFPANQEIRFMLIELLRAASREDEARKQVEVVAQELESRGDAVGAQRTREQLEEEAEEVEEVRPTPSGPRRPGVSRHRLCAGIAARNHAALPDRGTTRRHGAGRRRRHRRPRCRPRRSNRPSKWPRRRNASRNRVEDMPLIDADPRRRTRREVARLDDLIEEVAASPGDAVPGEIDIMLEPAFESADEDDAADSWPARGARGADASRGRGGARRIRGRGAARNRRNCSPATLMPRRACWGSPKWPEELEPLGEMETLEEFAVTEEFADAATDADEFFVAD